MDAWYMLDLGDAMLAGEALDAVRRDFERLAGEGRGSAVLMRHESDGRLHCELKLYFPPPLARLARDAGARPCAAPAVAGLGVMVGDRDCLARLSQGPAG